MVSHKAEPDRAKRLVDFAASNPVDRQRLKLTYGHLMECMANTHEHAGARPGEKMWWASVFKDTRRSCDCFTFIDMGVGIFHSQELGIRLLVSKITGSRPDILHELLLGKIRSSTDKNYRGRGLPGLHDECIAGRIARLTIGTNDVIADVANGKYSTLPKGLRGVLLYWEVPHESSAETPSS